MSTWYDANTKYVTHANAVLLLIYFFTLIHDLLFAPYLYNRVYSELTSRNSLSRSCLACSRLSGHIEPTTTESASTGDLPSVK